MYNTWSTLRVHKTTIRHLLCVSVNIYRQTLEEKFQEVTGPKKDKMSEQFRVLGLYSIMRKFVSDFGRLLQSVQKERQLTGQNDFTETA